VLTHPETDTVTRWDVLCGPNRVPCEPGSGGFLNGPAGEDWGDPYDAGYDYLVAGNNNPTYEAFCYPPDEIVR
jgi:hypothetical protein